MRAPAPRKISVCESSTFLSSPAEAAFPPTMSTDASLGLSCMGYQSSEVAFNLCEADGFLRVRSVGATSRAHTATKQDSAQRAKAGYYPRCARAMHVAT